MNLSIITPTGTVFNGQVERVLLPAVLGPFEVLANHAPIMSSLTIGKVMYAIAGVLDSFWVKSGVVSIADNEIVVVCEPCEPTV